MKKKKTLVFFASSYKRYLRSTYNNTEVGNDTVDYQEFLIARDKAQEVCLDLEGTRTVYSNFSSDEKVNENEEPTRFITIKWKVTVYAFIAIAALLVICIWKLVKNQSLFIVAGFFVFGKVIRLLGRAESASFRDHSFIWNGPWCLSYGDHSCNGRVTTCPFRSFLYGHDKSMSLHDHLLNNQLRYILARRHFEGHLFLLKGVSETVLLAMKKLTRDLVFFVESSVARWVTVDDVSQDWVASVC